MFSFDVLPWVNHFFESASVSFSDLRQASVLCASPMGDLALDSSIQCEQVDVLCEDLQSRALLELKLCALKELAPAGRATLFGLNPKGRRVFLFHHMKHAMSLEAQSWWMDREQLIRQGLARSGQHDHIMAFWRRAARGDSFERISLRQRLAIKALFRSLAHLSAEDINPEERFESMSLEAQRSWIVAPQDPAWLSVEQPVCTPRLVLSAEKKYDSVLLYKPSERVLALADSSVKTKGHMWCWSWKCPDEPWSKVKDECRVPFTPWLWYKKAP